MNAGYNFNHKNSLWSSYAKNRKADKEANAWQVEYDYGTYDNNPEKGDWTVYAAYRRLGANTSLMGSYDGAMRGTKGWEIGGEYTFAKNIIGFLKYGQGSDITADANGKDDARKFFGRVDFFF